MKSDNKKAKSLETQLDTLKTLSDIGREITSTLDMEKILFTIYKKVNKLMDATIFGIGLYQPEKKCIEYKLALAENKKYKPYTRDTKDKNQFPVWCIENKKPVFINDVNKEYKKYLKKNKTLEAALEDGSKEKVVHSILYLPIIVKKKVIGIISVQSYKKHAYSAYHLDVLQNIAAYAGMAIENARHFHEIEEKVTTRTKDIIRQQKEIEESHQHTKLLSDIGREIAASLSVKEILEKTYKNVNKLMDATSFGIAIFNKEENHLNFICNIEKGKPLPFHFVDIEKDNRPAAWCFNNQKAVFMNDFLKDYKKYNLNKPKGALSGEFTHSIIYLPLTSKNKQIGVITIQSFNRNAYTEYHLDILSNLAVYVVNALENARLYQDMEAEVKLRTVEVIKQKEEIEKSYDDTKLLSDIGREITASLSVEEITAKVYKSVNTLMDASVLAIGLHEPENNRLCFPGDIEKGEKLELGYEDLTDDSRSAVWCFKKQKQMIINNFDKEYKNYFPGKVRSAPLIGESPESLIYLPLSTPNKQLGVITVQSFKQNAYSEYHLNILKNLAIYVVIAVENANLYENLKKRTEETEKQKAEIEKSYHDTRLLSDIGRKITASLSVEEITENAYKNVNSLMDASIFGIGIFNKKENRLDFSGDIEKGKKIPFSFEELSDANRPSVWCFKNQKEVVINNLKKEYQKYFPGKEIPKVISGEVSESLIYLPLTTPTKQLGVITIQCFKEDAYSDYHLNILRNLAIYVSIALENARLYDNLKKRTKKIEAQKEEIEKSYNNTKLLSDIGREITTSLSVEEISQKVYKNVNTLMDASVFGIALFNENANRMDFPGVIEKGKKMPFGFNLLTDDNRPSVWCFKNQKDVIINDFQKEYHNYFPGKEIPKAVAGEDCESLVYLPLSTSNRKIGVMTVQSFSQNAYSEYHLHILKNLAIYIVIALENARLYGNMEEEVKQRTAEIEKQKEELEKLSVVASETDNAVIIADAEGNMQWVNAGFTRLTGYDLKSLKEKRGANIMEISGNSQIKELIKECIEHRRFMVYDTMNKTIDGRDIWVQTTLTPILDQQGKIKNLVTIDSDITKLKLIELEMRTQHEIISEKNKHITDSINYAKRIQDAILPSSDVIKNILPESFILFKPKDIVSGDFYWITEKKGKLFFAVVDCTGHGVPGAFVSIIGHNGLYRAINEFGLDKPSEILDKLNDLVEETFRQNNTTQINDGMDIALCSYDRNLKILEFSGANNPLYYISNGSLSEIKGDKQPIGAFDNRKKFTNHIVNLKKDDLIYVFSDGYADQFGGTAGKKFKYNQFKGVLLSLQGTAMTEQHAILDNTISTWMNGFEQLDDICVIGMKVSS
ncbi:MAG: GAF domain-containing protein [Bacteroidota bacterium]